VFLAGVDEAGYGPLLGPLTVGFACFRVPSPGTDLWEVLRETAARRPGRRDRRLRVDDSKRVNQGPRGRERMERTVLAFRELLRPASPGWERDLRAWVEEPPSGRSGERERAPWLRDLDHPLGTTVSRERARLDAAALDRHLRRGGAHLAAFGARAVPAVEWNRLLDRHGGKAGAHFAAVAEVLRHLLRETAGAPLRVEVDRHGARTRYRDLLERSLAPEAIEVHGEGPRGSAYTLHQGGREIQIRFQEEAEDRHFPVALASLAAKHTRERLMDLWNAWFGRRAPALRPTKGYTQDGRRWLQEAGGLLRELELPAEVLVRRL